MKMVKEMVAQKNILLALHNMRGIGWKTIECFIINRINFTDIISMEAKQLIQLGISQQKAKQITKELNISFVEQIVARYNASKWNYMTIFDADYPYLLRHISDPPWVLYYIGDRSCLDRLCISVVGTRTPTQYGRRIAKQLSEQLSANGFCIVSGMAKGIDASAHEGALSSTGSTIAIMGTAINQIYPVSHEQLHHRIAENGLILSEYPLDFPSHPALFPRRNRIIAGLSIGTVIVEAALVSGSLITADLALDESRDLFAIPGPITSVKSQGPFSLIHKGTAKMVTSVEDILSEYRHMINIEKRNEREGNAGGAELTHDETQLISFISAQPISIDELLEQSKFSFGHLHSVLLSLVMKNKIEQLPGSLYITL